MKSYFNYKRIYRIKKYLKGQSDRCSIWVSRVEVGNGGERERMNRNSVLGRGEKEELREKVKFGSWKEDKS